MESDWKGWQALMSEKQKMLDHYRKRLNDVKNARKYNPCTLTAMQTKAEECYLILATVFDAEEEAKQIRGG